jgi:hypothetical protein
LSEFAVGYTEIASMTWIVHACCIYAVVLKAAYFPVCVKEYRDKKPLNDSVLLVLNEGQLMKKMILTVVLSLVSTAVFAQLTMNSATNNTSTSTSSVSATSQQMSTIDLLGGDTVAGLGTSDTVAGLSGTDSQTINPTSSSSPMPAFGHTGNLRQPGSIRH